MFLSIQHAKNEKKKMNLYDGIYNIINVWAPIPSGGRVRMCVREGIINTIMYGISHIGRYFGLGEVGGVSTGLVSTPACA